MTTTTIAAVLTEWREKYACTTQYVQHHSVVTGTCVLCQDLKRNSMLESLAHTCMYSIMLSCVHFQVYMHVISQNKFQWLILRFVYDC